MAENFQVQITTPVQLEGAKQLADQLEKDIGKAKALGQATEELEAKLKTVQGAVENAAPAAHKLEISHRELKESVRGAANAFGGFGEVGMLLSGPTAAVFALIQLVEVLRERFAALMEAAVQAREEMAAFDAAKIQSAADAARETADAMEAYVTAQHDATSGLAAMAAAAKAESSQRLAEIDAEIDAAKRLNEEEEKLAESRIDRMVETGQITQEEGDRRKHIEQERMAAANANLDAEKEAKRIQEEKNALTGAIAHLPVELDQQKAALAGGEVANKEKKRLEKQAEAAQKAAEAARKKAVETAADASEYGAGRTAAAVKDIAVGSLLKPLMGADTFAIGKQNRDTEAAKAEQYAKMMEARNEQIQALIREDTKTAETAKKKAEALEKQIEEDRKTVTEAPAKIASDERLAAIHRQSADAALQRQGQTHQTQEAGRHEANLNRVSGLTEAQRDVAEARTRIEAGVETGADLHALLVNLIGTAKFLHDRHSSLADKYDDLAQQVRDLETNVRTSR